MRRQTLWNGNIEPPLWTIFTNAEHNVRWAWTTHGKNAQRIAALHREVGVPVTKVLHLKSAITALPDGTVIAYPPLVDDTERWDHFLAVPEEAGSHVVILHTETVLMSSSAPQTRKLFEQHGLRVVEVDITEFEKLEGCVTCLSVRLR